MLKNGSDPRIKKKDFGWREVIEVPRGATIVVVKVDNW